MYEDRVARKGLMEEVSGGQVWGKTEVRLDGWCENGLGQQRDTGGG